MAHALEPFNLRCASLVQPEMLGQTQTLLDAGPDGDLSEEPVWGDLAGDAGVSLLLGCRGREAL